MTTTQNTIRVMYLVTTVVSCLIVLKIVVGIIASSSALISDAVHSVTDLIVAIASLVGLRLANRPPDKRFTYGYYKVENIITLFISLVILVQRESLFMKG